MKKNIFKMPQFWLATALTVLPTVFEIIVYNKLPAEMAIHYDINFNPDGYGPKELVVFGFPLLFVVLNTIVWFALNNDPKGKNINRPLLLFGTWIIPVLSCFMQFVLIMNALGAKFNFVTLLPAFIGIIFIILGNYLPKCKQNYVAGFRTPWTLNNKENWRKTNRLAGYLMVIAGFLMVLCSFFGQFFYIVIIIILLTGIIPYGYSYYLYRKEA